MQAHPYKTLLIYGVIILSGITVLPTVGWMTLDDETRTARLETWHAEDQERAKEESTYINRMVWSVKRWSQFDRDRVINLGLDLQGGIHMVVGFDMPDEIEREARQLDEADVQDMVLQRIRNRVNDFEAKEPTIQKLGSNQIQIQLPGEKDIQRAKDLIMQTAYLTFHMVSGPDETERLYRVIDAFSENNFVPFLDPPFNRGNPYRVSLDNYDRVAKVIADATAAGIIPEDKTLAFSTPPRPWEEQGSYILYLLEKEAAATGEGLTSAVARPDQSSPGQWQIIFEFNADGARVFAEATGNNIGRNMAIVLDDKVVSAPNIEGRIFSTGNITGNFTANESRDLAISLNSGSMPVPIREDYTGIVGATLGADSVNKGIRSSIVGLLFVMVFMVAYYRVAGLVANIALAVNALLIIAALAYFNATLTLPGIAGLILTVGMAVDANVLIFERIREELRNGKSLASSIEGGYQKATMTILDANVTTLIAAAVLTQFGTGPVQGFAVTLSIGVCASVFAALVVTRAVLDFLTSRKMISDLAMQSILKGEPKFKFLEKRRLAATGSAIAVIIGLVIFGARGNENFGVDFTNGTNMIIALDNEAPISVGDIRGALVDAGFDTPTVQEYQEHPDAMNEFVVRVGDVSEITSASTEEEKVEGSISTRVQRALLPLTSSGGPGDLDSALGDHVDEIAANEAAAEGTEDLGAAVELLRVETVGPAVGAQLQRDAVAAIAYALFFIVAYLWFRFELKFAVGAVVALTHDVLITLGIFALMGREITIPVVAAILTIIGYSLNDTIVVFDRIREDLKLQRGRGLSFMEIVNVAINRTLSRTLLTSLTTLFVVVVLFFFGGAAINDFALALIIGILVGTYSSIFVASPVVVLWEQWRERRLGPHAGGGGGGGGGTGGGGNDDVDSPKTGRKMKKKKKARPGGQKGSPA